MGRKEAGRGNLETPVGGCVEPGAGLVRGNPASLGWTWRGHRAGTHVETEPWRVRGPDYIRASMGRIAWYRR